MKMARFCITCLTEDLLVRISVKCFLDATHKGKQVLPQHLKKSVAMRLICEIRSAQPHPIEGEGKRNAKPIQGGVAVFRTRATFPLHRKFDRRIYENGYDQKR